jgi:cytochrome-b5 reductase
VIFANVSEEDIILRNDLEALARDSPKIEVFYALERPPKDWRYGVCTTNQSIHMLVSRSVSE